MSTRTNVIVKQTLPNGELKERCLYRHCDGYLSGTGFELIDEARKMKHNGITEFSDVCLHLLDVGPYESCPEGIHCDVEFIYHLIIKEGGFEIRAYEAKWDVGTKPAKYGKELTEELIAHYKDEGRSFDIGPGPSQEKIREFLIERCKQCTAYAPMILPEVVAYLESEKSGDWSGWVDLDSQQSSKEQLEQK